MMVSFACPREDNNCAYSVTIADIAERDFFGHDAIIDAERILAANAHGYSLRLELRWCAFLAPLLFLAPEAPLFVSKWHLLFPPR